MVRPVYVERVPAGEVARLKIVSTSFEEEELAPLDELWHYECVVSPRSPAAKLRSSPVSPRSPAAKLLSSPRSPSASSPPSPAARSPRSPYSPPISPRSPLSRFAPSQQSLHRVFSTFDENGDGSVSTQEISRIFQKLGISRSEEDSLLTNIPSLVSKVPGHVDEEEFMLLYESACQLDETPSSSTVNAGVDEDLLAAFHVFDKDGNGFISPAELQSVLCSLGFPQGRQLDACEDMIASVDENEDGQVDFFEFTKLFNMDNPFMTTIQSF